jgi:hypothetical protein
MADPVVGVVAQHRRREQHAAQHPDVHAAGGRQGPGHSSESPGRKGNTTSPVSQKMIRKRIT